MRRGQLIERLLAARVEIDLREQEPEVHVSWEYVLPEEYRDSRMSEVTRAPVGTEFEIQGQLGPAQFVVGEKCDQNSGRWVCVTHGVVFATQLEKDIHITGEETEDHVLAWACIEHGAETP